MKTRPKKSTSVVNTLEIKEISNRKPLSDKTNNANTSNNMKRKKNEKQPTIVASKIATRQTRNSRQSGTKNKVDKTNLVDNNLRSKNARAVANKTNVNENKTSFQSDVKDDYKNVPLNINNGVKETFEDEINTENKENSINTPNRLNIRRRSTRFSIETKSKTTSRSNKVATKFIKDASISNEDTSKSKEDASKSKKDALKSKEDASKLSKVASKCNEDASKFNTGDSKSITTSSILDTNIQENPQQTNEINNSVNKNDQIINSVQQNEENNKNSVNTQNKLNIRRRSSRLSIEAKIKPASKSNKNAPKFNKDTTKTNKDTIKTNKDAAKTNKDAAKTNKDTTRTNKDTTRTNKDTTKTNKDAIKSVKEASKSDQTVQKNQQETDEINNSKNKQKLELNAQNEETKTKLNTQSRVNLRRRSSRFSTETKIKATLKTNKNAANNKGRSGKEKGTEPNEKLEDKKISNKNEQNPKNQDDSINKQNKLNTRRRSSRFSIETNLKPPSTKPDTNVQEIEDINSNKQNEEKKNSPLKTKRLLNCLKSPSPENSDPYEFKFDPEEEPKRKPKRRGRRKKHDTLLDTSEEADNSMKPIVKNLRRKVEMEQKIRVTPVERKLRNRLVKVERQAGLVPQITNKTNAINSEVNAQNANIIAANNANVINTSVVDEINEIANTFLEDDDDVFNDTDVSISTPSRIDIISNLIARKSIKIPRTNVFNSTMIQETPQQHRENHLSPARSPWRVEVSAIPRKSLNFSVKNKSFTPSYTPDIITNNKKQSTLLGFVNRTPRNDLPITLFENSPTRKPFENLSNSMSPIRSNTSNISAAKRSDDSLFGFTVLSDSEDKENSPVVADKQSSRNKIKMPENKQPECDIKINESVKVNEPPIDISIPLFEDLDEKPKDKRYSRQYTRPQIKRKRNVSLKIDSSDDSDSETEVHPVKKKQKDVLSKEEAEEAERLASHYNSYFEEIENYPLCIE